MWVRCLRGVLSVFRHFVMFCDAFHGYGYIDVICMSGCIYNFLVHSAVADKVQSDCRRVL